MRALIVLAVLVAMAPDASAQDARLRQRIIDANTMVNQARRYLKDKVDLSIREYEYAIQEVEPQLQTARKRIAPEMRQDAEGWKVFSDNLTDAEDVLAHMKRALACARAKKPIVDLHGDRKPAPEPLHASYDAAVKAFAAAARPSWAKPVEYLQSDAAALRARSAELAAAEDKARQAAAARAEEERRAGLVRSANKVLDQLIDELQGDELEQETVDALASAAAAVAAVDPRAGKFYAHEFAHWRLAAALARPEPGNAAAVLELVGGRQIGAGTTRGKKAAIRVKAAADECVMVFARLVRYGTGEVDEQGWADKAASSPLQEIEIHRRGRGWGNLIYRGFCALRPVDTTWSAELKVPGTTNGLRWIAVAWPRPAMPAFLTAELRLFAGDPCDFDHWKALWLRPVPGSVLLDDGDPILVLEPPDGPYYFRGQSLEVEDARGGNRSVSSLASSGRVKVRSTLDWRGCPGEPFRAAATSELSRKRLACSDRIDARHAGQWKRINALRDAADRRGGISPAAEQMASRLDDQQDREYARECGPLEKQAEKRAQATYDALVDFFSDHPPTDPGNRADMIKLLADAPWRAPRD